MDSNQLISKSIAVARFPMMALIVLLHSKIKDPCMPAAANDVMVFVAETLCRVAVPLFFLISGFLFFYKRDASQPGFFSCQLKKRVHTLLIPYLLWNLIALVYTWIKTLPFMGTLFPNMVGVKLTFWDAVNAFGKFTFVPDHGFLGIYDPACTPEDGPLWFVRDLLVMILFSPLIYRIMKSKLGPIVCVGLVGCFIIGLWPYACLYFSLTGVTFFCLGCFLGVRNINPFNNVGKLGVMAGCCAAVYLIAAVGRVAYLGTPLSERLLAASILIGVPLFMMICAILVKRGVEPSRFSGAPTFFMYAVHAMIVSPVQRLVIFVVNPQSSVGYIASVFCVVIIVIAVSLTLYYIVARVSPRFAALLTGSRSR